MCRLGANTSKIFGVRKDITLPYMRAKYNWIAPHGVGDMLIQKLGFLGKLKKCPNFGLLRNSLRNGQILVKIYQKVAHFFLRGHQPQPL